MSAALEAFLAQIYVDDEARARFLADPRREASRAGLPEDTCAALAAIDRAGLELAAASFAHKRTTARARRPRWLLRFRRLLPRLGGSGPGFSAPTGKKGSAFGGP